MPFGKVESDAYPTYFDFSYDHFVGKKYFLRASFAVWAFDKFEYENYKNEESSYGIRLGVGGTVFKFMNDKLHVNWMFSGRNYDAKTVKTSLFFDDVFSEKKYQGFTIQASPIVRWQFPHWQLSLQSHFSLLDLRKTSSKDFANNSVITESSEEIRVLKFPSDFLIGISIGYSFTKKDNSVSSKKSL